MFLTFFFTYDLDTINVTLISTIRGDCQRIKEFFLIYKCFQTLKLLLFLNFFTIYDSNNYVHVVVNSFLKKKQVNLALGVSSSIEIGRIHRVFMNV